MEKGEIQERQYSFPYHHLTHVEDGGLFVFRHLFWGLIHHSYLQYVIDKIIDLNPECITDVGCGEGRLICELEKRPASGKLNGIDVSSRAIKFAEAFSHRGHFLVHDIIEKPLDYKSDLIVSCEVIEHVPPDKVQGLIDNIAISLKSGGKIILTTPTTNVPTDTKHYQHFTATMFDRLLSKDFINTQYTYLNKENLFAKVLKTLLANRFYLSNSKSFNRLVLNLYKKHLLIATEKTGSRIMVIAEKKASS